MKDENQDLHDRVWTSATFDGDRHAKNLMDHDLLRSDGTLPVQAGFASLSYARERPKGYVQITRSRDSVGCYRSLARSHALSGRHKTQGAQRREDIVTLFANSRTYASRSALVRSCGPLAQSSSTDEGLERIGWRHVLGSW